MRRYTTWFKNAKNEIHKAIIWAENLSDAIQEANKRSKKYPEYTVVETRAGWWDRRPPAPEPIGA